jgi:hypothetical protein
MQKAIGNENEKDKIAPFRLRFTPQFSQLIHAALFCAAIIRNLKDRCKAGTKSPAPPLC